MPRSRWIRVWFCAYVLASVVLSLAPVAEADADTARRMEREAQVQSNNGNYNDARQLRAIADALKQRDAVISRQIQGEVNKGQYDKAKDLLNIR